MPRTVIEVAIAFLVTMVIIALPAIAGMITN